MFAALLTSAAAFVAVLAVLLTPLTSAVSFFYSIFIVCIPLTEPLSFDISFVVFFLFHLSVPLVSLLSPACSSASAVTAVFDALPDADVPCCFCFYGS